MVLRLSPLYHVSDHVALDFLPTGLQMPEIVILVLLFVAKSVWNGITLLIVGSGSRKHGKAPKTDMPKMSLSMPFKVTDDDVARYKTATGCSKDQIDAHRVQRLLFLSAITEPAMLLLIAKRGCPIQPLGSVNVRNTFELLRPDMCTLSKLSSLSSGKGGLVLASLGSPARLVKRGVEFDLNVEISIQESNSSPVTVFRQVFTMLQFTKIPSSAKLSDVMRDPGFTFGAASLPTGQLKIGWNDPAKWARVCKDYNPIHISGFAAKMFGLPSKIAHGNHIAAIAMRDLLGDDDSATIPCRMEVYFRRPVTVPNKLDLFHETVDINAQSETHFAVGRIDKVNIQGKYQNI